MAQKNVVNLISLMLNSTESKVIITTHSPYILTSLNILLYSDKVENNPRMKGTSIIPRNMRINYKTFGAYKLENIDNNYNSVESLMDEESHMINTDYIDQVSSITNAELDGLLDKELDG